MKRPQSNSRLPVGIECGNQPPVAIATNTQCYPRNRWPEGQLPDVAANSVTYIPIATYFHVIGM